MPKFAEKAMKVDVVKTGQQLRGEQTCTIASADSASSSIKIRKKKKWKSLASQLEVESP